MSETTSRPGAGATYEGSIDIARGATVIAIEECCCWDQCYELDLLDLRLGSRASATIRTPSGKLLRIEHARWTSFTTKEDQ